jgi:hypothetical protein
VWNAIAAMLKAIICLGLFFSIGSCKKTDGDQPHPCASANPNCSHWSGDIVGSWILESSGSYRAPGGTLSWQAANCDSATIIQFNADSSFTYNDHFRWKDLGYDRFSMNGPKNFIIYSDTLIYLHQITGEVLNDREIRIHFMGVDTGTEENYDCN